MKNPSSSRHKTLAGFLLADGLLTLVIVPTTNATVLTFERDGGPLVNYAGSAWPANYGDRVATLSYIPPNYSAYVLPTWFYGAAGGFTPHIRADYRVTQDHEVEAWGHSTGGDYGDLSQVFSGTGASTDNDYIKVILTADPGYLVLLSSFDIANKVGDRPLHSLQIIADGSTVFSQSNVPIEGGTTAGVDFSHFAGSWQGNQITLLLEATFDSVLYNTNPDEAQARHISRFGLDNVSFSEVAVPDGGSSAVLLSMACAGVFALRRRPAQQPSSV